MKTLILVALTLSAFTTSCAQQLKIFHIDVDQADATLFIAPSGNTLLVDAGKNGHGPRIKRIMDQEGITRIDYFVNTHYHEDHLGGIDDLALDPAITIGVAYDRGDKQFLPASKHTEPTFRDYMRTVGEDAVTLTPGMQIPLDNTMSVTCLSQGGVVIGDSSPSDADEENDMSLSLLITYGGFRYFVGGDIESPTEGRIAARDLALNVDMYQANHHGSHSSSSLPFMQDLVPSVIIISNGSNDSYYHPRQVTLNTYNQLSPRPVVLQTNKYLGTKDAAGNVADNFIADLNTQGDEGAISVLVNLTQNNYVVRWGSQSQTFSIKAPTTATAFGLVIDRLMPDPEGSDTAGEYVTIRNGGQSAITLAGWYLMDASSRIWPLDTSGTIQAGQSMRIMRNGRAMSLNNEGDIVFLYNPSNLVVDEFRYSGCSEGVELTTGH